MTSGHQYMHFYSPAEGHGLAADPFRAIVCPRPIGWISTLSADNIPNLAPYSFFNAVSDMPPCVAFASDGWKDTVSNVAATREFAVNFVSRDLIDAMNRTSIRHPPGVDEFSAAGIERAPCRNISVPRVAESPAVLECKLLQIVELRDLSGATTQYKIAIGQVVGVHISKVFLEDGLFKTGAARPAVRAGYRGQYFQIDPDKEFTVTRPIGS